MTAGNRKQKSKDHPSYDIHAAISLHRSGRHKEAAVAYQYLLSRTPNNFDANHMYALFLWDSGQKADAVIQFKKTVKLDPRFAPVLYNFGCLLIETEEYKQAIDSLSQAIMLSPHSDQLYLARGNAYRYLREFDEAAKNYRDAIALNPRFTEAWSNLGYVLNQLHNYHEALHAYQQALEIEPDRFEVYLNKANVLRALNRYDEALECCTRAENISYKKNFELKQNELVDLIINRAKIYQDQKNSKMAFQILDRYPVQNIKILMLKANILRDNQKFTEAKQIYQQCLALDPENPNVHWHKSLMDLSLKDYDQGWKGYEYRYNVDGFHTSSGGSKSIPENFIKKFPTIHDIKDRDVYIISEQGIGDQVMFLSIIPDLRSIAGKITCEVDDRLLKILKNSFSDIIFVSKQYVMADYQIKNNLVIRMGSLPHIFRKKIEDFPGSPYLNVTNESLDHFRDIVEKLQKNDGPKIALSWKGGTSLSRSEDRSIKLETILSKLDRKKNLNFYCIQHGEIDLELENLNEKFRKNFNLIPKEQINDIDNLCGLLQNVDVILSVQNTNIHLAGAIGKQCIAMINANPEWRYGYYGHKMPWYNSVNLIRQTILGDWTEVFSELERILKY